MVEILFTGGKARELRQEDLVTLVDLCQDKEVLEYFFSSGTRAISLYWDIQLQEQRRWAGQIKEDRTRYVLPIEHEEIVKGCLVLDVKQDDCKKNSLYRLWGHNHWTNNLPDRKDPRAHSWGVDLDSVSRRKMKHIPQDPKPPQLRSDGPIVERSYFIGEAYRRKGLATKIGEKAIEFASEKLRARKVVAHVLESNIAARTVLEKRGYQVEEKTISISGPRAGENVYHYNLSCSNLDAILSGWPTFA